MNDSNEDEPLKTISMAQLMVRKANREVVGTLKHKAAANERSAKVEHREILCTPLLDTEEDFAVLVSGSVRRSAVPIRVDHDRNGTGPVVWSMPALW